MILIEPHLSKPASRTIGSEPCSSFGPSKCPAHTGPTKLERMGSEARLVYKTNTMHQSSTKQTRKAIAQMRELTTTDM